MRSTALSKIPDGVESTIAQDLWNYSTPQGKEIWWITEEDGLEVGPVDIKTVLDRYALAVILYTIGGHKWIDKPHFLSNMIVCHWNEVDDDYFFYCSSTYIGTTCTCGNSEVITLNLSEILRNVEP